MISINSPGYPEGVSRSDTQICSTRLVTSNDHNGIVNMAGSYHSKDVCVVLCSYWKVIQILYSARN